MRDKLVIKYQIFTISRPSCHCANLPIENFDKSCSGMEGSDFTQMKIYRAFCLETLNSLREREKSLENDIFFYEYTSNKKMFYHQKHDCLFFADCSMVKATQVFASSTALTSAASSEAASSTTISTITTVDILDKKNEDKMCSEFRKSAHNLQVSRRG